MNAQVALAVGIVNGRVHTDRTTPCFAASSSPRRASDRLAGPAGPRPDGAAEPFRLTDTDRHSVGAERLWQGVFS